MVTSLFFLLFLIRSININEFQLDLNFPAAPSVPRVPDDCFSFDPFPEGALPYKRLMGMCHWMGSHFHDWIDYNGVAFSIVTRMGSHIFDFWG